VLAIASSGFTRCCSQSIKQNFLEWPKSNSRLSGGPVRSSVAKMLTQNAIFSKKLSNLELWCLLTTYRKSYKQPIIVPLKFKTVDIRNLENRQIATSERKIIGVDCW